MLAVRRIAAIPVARPVAHPPKLRDRVRRRPGEGDVAMSHHELFYIGGRWVEPARPATLDVVDPSTEQPFTRIAAGAAADVDRAVASARLGFEGFSTTSREERLALLRRILDAYNRRAGDLAEAVSREMGAPLPFALDAQVWAGRVHLEATIEALETYEFSRLKGSSLDRPGADRRRRPDHAVELAAEPDRLQGRSRARRRLCGRPEAERDRPDQRRPVRGNRRGGGRAARGLQSRQRNRGGRRPGHGGASGRRHGVVHGLDPRRNSCRQGGG